MASWDETPCAECGGPWRADVHLEVTDVRRKHERHVYRPAPTAEEGKDG